LFLPLFDFTEDNAGEAPDSDSSGDDAIGRRIDSGADLVERLFREFETKYTLTDIFAAVRVAESDLAGSPAGALPELVERLVRQRLSDSRGWR